MKKTKSQKHAPTPSVLKVFLNDTEKRILSDLLQKETILTEEITKLRSTMATLVTVIAARGGLSVEAHLNLNTEDWSVSI